MKKSLDDFFMANKKTVIMAPRYINEAILAAREDEILDQALVIIEQQGLTALTMDKVVASVNYSKGTVYNHFSSKEDLYTALCNRNMRQLAKLFRRAVDIDTSERHKMTAIGFAYMLMVLLTPQSFTLMMNAKTEIFEKATPERGEEHEALDNVLFTICNQVIQAAIAKKELTLKPGIDEQQATFSIYAMAFGTMGLLLKKDNACQSTMGGLMLEDRVLAHGNMIMDGLGWLAATTPESEFIDHLKQQVFAEEIATLHKCGVDLQQGI